MNTINKISELITNLFSDENPTVISVKQFYDIPLNTWEYINDGEIRFKIIEFNEFRCIAITEWMQDSIFNLHAHNDADETIFIIEGMLYSIIDSIKRYAFQKLFYKANVMHKIKGFKGTKISVEFKFT